MISSGIGCSGEVSRTAPACSALSMRFEAYPSPTDLTLKPSGSLAFGIALVGLLALGSVWMSQLPVLLAIFLSTALALAVALAVRGFLRPSLGLRLHKERLEYRRGPGQPWVALLPTDRCFVSPWFIGWRDSRLCALGIFRPQLTPDDFRRVMVLLRHKPAG